MHFNDRSASVTFFSERDGEIIYSKVFDGATVCKNQSFVDIPHIPVTPEESVIFDDWYYSSGGIEKRYDSTQVITGNLEIYAKWLHLYNVMFISDGATYLSLICIEGETVDAPPLESKPGRTFEGWYIDPNCTVPYDPVAGITQDQAVYAKWSEPKDTKELLAPFLLVPFGIAAAVIGLRHIRVQKTVVRKNRRYR